MANISLSGAQLASQSILAQLRVQQARRNVEQAEQVARSLHEQAQEAQQHASAAEEEARSTATKANQAEGAAGQARQGVAAMESANRMQTQLTKVVARVEEKLKVEEPNTAVQKPAPAVINAQGQTTGRIINTTA